MFGSGLAALVYQTAWQRSFRLVFGASTAASAAVLGVFLAGLGLGGLWLGRRAERSERPLMFYGNLELIAAVIAAASPFLIELSSKAYFALGGASRLGVGGATVVRVLIVAVCIGPAVVAMGGTLPAAAREVETETDAARGRVALLYGINTIGAVCGALFGTFLLFELFGTRLSLWVAALLNILVGVIARAVGRASAPLPTVSVPEPTANVEATSKSPPVWQKHFAFGAAAVAGFAYLALELVWYRMLAPILGGTTFTFGLVLAVALAGVGLGGYLYSRRSADQPATLIGLAAVSGLEALGVVVPFALGDYVALYAAYTRPLASLGFPALVVSWASICTLVVLPASIAAGYQFPLLVALLGHGRRDVARHVGVLYAFNTGGAVLGSLLGGFILLPRIGALGTWRLVTAALALLALGGVVSSIVAARREWHRALGRAVVPVITSAIALALLGAQGPTSVWRHRPIGAGRVDISELDRNQLRAWVGLARQAVVWEADGIESTVAITEADGLAFLVDGKADGSAFVDHGTQTMSGLLAALVHGKPRRTFVVGLGTGMTAGWLAAVPGMEKVDVAELEPSILEVARRCASINQRVLERPNVTVHLADGREMLLASRDQYDLIVSEPSNPYRAGVASLYTKELYEAVERRLAPRGIFAQWVQGYEVTPNAVLVVVGTLKSVLPRVEAWQTQRGDLLLLAAREPMVFDVERIRQRITEEPFRTALVRMWLVDSVEGVLSHFVGNSDLLSGIVRRRSPTLNADDLNILEYAFARSVGVEGLNATGKLIEYSMGAKGNRPTVRGNVDWARTDELRPRTYLTSGSRGPDLPMPDAETASRATAVSLGCTGELARALKSWRAQSVADPRDPLEAHVLAQALALQGKDDALPLAAQLAQNGFVAEAKLAEARLFAYDKRLEDAVRTLADGLEHMRREPYALCDTAERTIKLLEQHAAGNPALAKRAAEALLRAPLAARRENEQRLRSAQQLAFVAKDPTLCVRALGRLVEDPRWEPQFLEQRHVCLRAANHPLADRAEADFMEYMSAEGGGFE